MVSSRPPLSVWVLCAVGLRALELHWPGARGRLHWLGVALVAAGVTGLTLKLIPAPWRWLPPAVGFGCLLHLAADALTPEGVMWGWPWSERRSGLDLVGHTDGWGERFLVHPIATRAGLLFAWIDFAPTASHLFR